MSKDVVIQAKDLTKIYRLYAKPHYRFLDIFGLLRRNAGAYTEHAALDGINLQIQRGEKVAIIGRNGAGKSTFLKIVTGVIQPSWGQIMVNGNVHALLQIGTGFHPEFTGRENVYAYLAQLGVTGREAERKCAEIIDFAELEEYIDQPMKVYSTGMGVRLMFSTSTAISPDVLVLDEVLGVGDAYFTQKSYQRIREMCEGDGTTLLLVTHDIYTASKIASRVIWIDRGRILMDGDGVEVVHAYERSIRDQEEQRLRNRRLASLQENLKTMQPSHALIYGQIHRPDREIPEGRIFISHLRFLMDGIELATSSIGDDEAASQTIKLITDPGEGNWSQPVAWQGYQVREFLSYGSIYHKLPFIITNQEVLKAAEAGRLEVELSCFSATSQELEVALFFSNGVGQFTGQFSVPASTNWLKLHSIMTKYDAAAQKINLPQGIIRYGQHALTISDVRFFNGQDIETLQFEVGSDMRVRLNYQINDPDFCEAPTIIVAFQKDGVIRSHRFWTDQIQLSAAQAREGSLEVIANPLLLGQGSYLVTVSVFKEGYLTSSGSKIFFSANDQLYDMHSRAYEIVVKESQQYPLCNDVVFQHPSIWLLNGAKVAESRPLHEITTSIAQG